MGNDLDKSKSNENKYDLASYEVPKSTRPPLSTSRKNKGNKRNKNKDMEDNKQVEIKPSQEKSVGDKKPQERKETPIINDNKAKSSQKPESIKNENRKQKIHEPTQQAQIKKTKALNDSSVDVSYPKEAPEKFVKNSQRKEESKQVPQISPKKQSKRKNCKNVYFHHTAKLSKREEKTITPQSKPKNSQFEANPKFEPNPKFESTPKLQSSPSKPTPNSKNPSKPSKNSQNHPISQKPPKSQKIPLNTNLQDYPPLTSPSTPPQPPHPSISSQPPTHPSKLCLQKSSEFTPKNPPPQFTQHLSHLDLDSLFTYENFYNPSHKATLHLAQNRIHKGRKEGRHLFPNPHFPVKETNVDRQQWEEYEHYFQNWEMEIGSEEWDRLPVKGMGVFSCAQVREFMMQHHPPMFLWQMESNDYSINK